MATTLTVLGIESSCDDSAAAVVRVGGGVPEILANVVSSQTDLHAAFGGIVPEIAARAHAEILDGCVARALCDARLGLADIDLVAVTAGPGLIGGLASGVMLAKGIAAGAGLPLIAVNHLAGHALTPRLTERIDFPYLTLLASGGHCLFLSVEGADRFTRLGSTIDDAPGEAFDKVASMLGLSQPGGPAIERAAKDGSPSIPMPRPLANRPGCTMSFSGLKTAVLRARDERITAGTLSRGAQADLAASFQQAVVDIFAEKTRNAFAAFRQIHGESPDHGTGQGTGQGTGELTLAVCGGVAANERIRGALSTLAKENGARFVAPALALCTDNAAMIAYAGAERFLAGERDDMSLGVRSRWPLDTSQAPMLGSGKRGAKA